MSKRLSKTGDMERLIDREIERETDRIGEERKIGGGRGHEWYIKGGYIEQK